jgi:hypothetical protein
MYGGPQVSRQQFEMYTAQHLYYTATSALNVHGNFENPRQLYTSHGNFKNLTATLKIRGNFKNLTATLKIHGNFTNLTATLKISPQL